MTLAPFLSRGTHGCREYKGHICKVSHFLEICLVFLFQSFSGASSSCRLWQILTLYLHYLPFGSKMNLGMFEDLWGRTLMKFDMGTKLHPVHEVTGKRSGFMMHDQQKTTQCSGARVSRWELLSWCCLRNRSSPGTSEFVGSTVWNKCLQRFRISGYI